MIQLKKILAPTDFSKHSENAVRYAVQFAAKFGAELHLLHVIQIPIYADDSGLTFAGMLGDYQQEMLTYSTRTLGEIATPSNITTERIIKDGSPLMEILNYAKEQTIDLIVMATHGRTGLSHVLMGSVAEKVVRKAPCPVLTVRHPEHEFVMP